MSLRTLKAKLKIFGFVHRNAMNQNTAQKLEEAVKKELLLALILLIFSSI